MSVAKRTTKAAASAAHAANPAPASRVIVENVRPQVDAGRFAIKRVTGERVVVEADIYAEGHDRLSAVLLYKQADAAAWSEVAMEELANDRWHAQFVPEEIGSYTYTVIAWVDDFKTWKADLAKRVAAGQDLRVPLQVGAALVRDAAERADAADVRRLREWADALDHGATGIVERAVGDEMMALIGRYPDRSRATRYERELVVTVDRTRARFSTWYELFPRSCATEPGRHGTLRDVEAQLPYVASMGFDVLYLPPIHPIGRAHRKGKNNATESAPGDVGSPWAIGAAEGGHKSILPELGTLEDFRSLVQAASVHGLEIALDLAFQCSPEHPWVTEHPEWFRHRPDGSIQYAENPPKKYQDIYPLDFESVEWKGLWDELRSVVDFWIDQGVRIFRVDNPHTKPFPFWEWLIGGVRQQRPDVLFLAEAFTRPKIMAQLAKLGFSQSYTYFAWRNTKWELETYFTELTQTDMRESFRPNLWPNTPDILTEYLQQDGRPAFMTRLVLAAGLGASYGIYGPAFELCENRPREPRSEEYLDSEKYQIRRWDLQRSDSLRDFIALVNRIRHENPALQNDSSLRFHPVDNDELICFSKNSEDSSNVILIVVNLDFRHVQSGWVNLPLDFLQIDSRQPYQVHDLLTGSRFMWHGERNYVEIDPRVVPAHVLRIRRRLRTEQDFDYYQ